MNPNVQESIGQFVDNAGIVYILIRGDMPAISSHKLILHTNGTVYIKGITPDRWIQEIQRTICTSRVAEPVLRSQTRQLENTSESDSHGAQDKAETPGWTEDSEDRLHIHDGLDPPYSEYTVGRTRKESNSQRTEHRCSVTNRTSQSKYAHCRVDASLWLLVKYKPKASIMVPDFTISLYGSSCNSLFKVANFLIFFFCLLLSIPSCGGDFN